MDVNQVFKNPRGGYELICSTGPEYDSNPASSGTGGLYAIHSDNILDFNGNRPRQLLSHESGLYAFRIIPELNGEIVGFDHRTGGIRRSGIQTGWKCVCRDFLNHGIRHT
jgi:beta-fructofuranosidase